MENGVFYFLGNVPSHINHALPLYRSLGGTFVVLSQNSLEYCKSYGVDVIMVDDQPNLFLEFEGELVKDTIDFLNKHASVVIYYEIYPIAEHLSALQIMLTHGNSFKDYYIDWRRELMPFYDYFAGLGPLWEKKTIEAGVERDKILKVGLARQDDIVSSRGSDRKTKKILKAFGRRGKKVVTYMPTWWGPTSVNDVGLNILRYLSEEYVLIFRPHPSTPSELIDRYIEIIDTEKLNAFYVPEGNQYHLSIDDILSGSDLFIGDMSSVVLEALLAMKPILIAYGSGDRGQEEALYRPIFPALKAHPSITEHNVVKVNELIDAAINQSKSEVNYITSINRVFYGAEGGNVRQIEGFIKEKLRDRAFNDR